MRQMMVVSMDLHVGPVPIQQTYKLKKFSVSRNNLQGDKLQIESARRQSRDPDQ